MNTQSFKNHVRIHPLYHYVLVPVSFLLIILAIINAFLNFSFNSIILVPTTIIIHAAIFLVRDYAKKNQDRIIRNEQRLRYFQLTGNRLEAIEAVYSLGQLLALRFAGDKEFLEMLSKPQTQSETPEQIKKAIRKWNPDKMRI